MELSASQIQRTNEINILIIEDDPQLVDLVWEILKETGNFPFLFSSAGNLASGLELLIKEEFDIVLLDLALPDSKGLETLHKTLSQIPDIPVILLTGSDDEALAIEALQAGAQDYIIKGHNESIFLARSIRYAIERKRVQKELRLSEEKYRSILENIEDGYYEVDLYGNITFVNDSFSKILGYSHRECIGLNHFQIMDKENALMSRKAFSQIFNTKKPAKEFDCEVFKKSGQKCHVEVSVSIRKNSKGKPIGFCGIMRDITQRKYIEDALRMSELRYRILFNSIDDAICVFELTDNFMPGKHIEVNDAACKKLGYTREEFYNLSVTNIMAPKHKKDIEIYGKKLLSDKKLLFESNLITKSGKRIPVEINSLLFDLQGKTFFLCVARDITERKKVEEENLNLEKLQGVIEMAGAVCHELNQPLQIISGLVGLLSTDITKNNPRNTGSRKIHSEIQNEIQRISEINKKIMGITKYETKDYLDSKIIDIEKSSK